MSRSEQIAELRKLAISTFAKKNGKTSHHYSLETSDDEISISDEGEGYFHLTIREIEGPLHDVYVVFELGGEITLCTKTL